MPTDMDAFIQAVDDARRRLIREEGRNVSLREIIRRAGYSEKERPSVFYHLNQNRHTGEGSHRVPDELVTRLAQVLPITEGELRKAARVSAGFNVADEGPDVAYVVARFFSDENVSAEEKRAVTARLLQIIADETIRAGQ
jgi:hypothetical protein